MNHTFSFITNKQQVQQSGESISKANIHLYALRIFVNRNMYIGFVLTEVTFQIIQNHVIALNTNYLLLCHIITTKMLTVFQKCATDTVDAPDIRSK